MKISAILCFTLFLSFSCIVCFGDESDFSTNCDWRKPSKDALYSSPEIFWINMDSSLMRRQAMENHLDQVGHLHRRVKGLSISSDIYIPDDVRSNWDKYEARTHTSERLLHKTDPKFSSKYGNSTHFITGLVGRAKSNKLKEVGCTSSHLEAMRQAIYNNRSSSKYAVITEDDIFIPFNIDFDLLAKSAPSNFGIIQLFNSNEESMESVFKRYKGSSVLWHEVFQKQPGAFWSTCAYLINREVMKPIIDKVAYSMNGTVHIKLIAGIDKPCRPKLSQCCKPSGQYSFEFQHVPPCIWAARGFQADSIIYAMTKTYVLTVPLITNGAGGNQSTFHQDHVESIHQQAFARQRRYINSIIRKEVQLPNFASLACKTELVAEISVDRNHTCLYKPPPVSISTPHQYIIHSPESIFIDSIERKISDVTQHYVSSILKIPSVMVRTLYDSNLYIPEDLASVWDTENCKSNSKIISDSLNNSFTSSLMGKGYSVAFAGLCGHARPAILILKDLANTATYLRAISQALTRSDSSSPYAIISDDKVLQLFSINFEELIRSAPTGFGILAFYTTNEHLVEKSWTEYLRNKTNLWTSVGEKYIESISPKYFIINRHVLKPIMDKIVLNEYGNDTVSLSVVRLLAGVSRPCAPKECCTSSKHSSSTQDKKGGSTSSGNEIFRQQSPCILSPNGHRASSFLWKLAPLYLFRIPLVISGRYEAKNGIMLGTLDESDKKHRQIVNSIKEGQVQAPSFISIACQFKL